MAPGAAVPANGGRSATAAERSSGESGEQVRQLVEQRRGLRRGVAVTLRIHGEQRQTGGVEPGVDTAEPLVTDGQLADGEQQHEGHGHLVRDEQVPDTEPAIAEQRRRSSLHGPDNAVARAAGRREGRRQSEPYPVAAAIATAKSQTSGPKLTFISRGNGLVGLIDSVTRSSQWEKKNPAAPPPRRQQHALGQQLPDQPPAAGAQREANRHFAAPLAGARQQQSGQVRAGQRQHEPDEQPDEAQREPQLRRFDSNDAAR